MKYVYLSLLSILILWSTHNLQVIYEFSAIWVIVLNIALVALFSFMLEVSLPVKKIRKLFRINSFSR